VKKIRRNGGRTVRGRKVGRGRTGRGRKRGRGRTLGGKNKE
jgi:hypothetical protein